MTLYRAVFRSVDRSSVERTYEADQVDLSSPEWCVLFRSGGQSEIRHVSGVLEWVFQNPLVFVAAFPRESLVLIETADDP